MRALREYGGELPCGHVAQFATEIHPGKKRIEFAMPCAMCAPEGAVRSWPQGVERLRRYARAVLFGALVWVRP